MKNQLKRARFTRFKRNIGSYRGRMLTRLCDRVFKWYNGHVTSATENEFRSVDVSSYASENYIKELRIWRVLTCIKRRDEIVMQRTSVRSK